MDVNPIVLDDTAGDVIVVVVEGEHDIYTAPTLRERLEEALGRGGGIVVDLTGATFVDSSVLGALLDARRRALESAQGFVVCVGESVEPGVQRILDITGLVPVLPVMRGARTRRSTQRGPTAPANERSRARGRAQHGRAARGRRRGAPGAGGDGRRAGLRRLRAGRHEDGGHRGVHQRRRARLRRGRRPAAGRDARRRGGPHDRRARPRRPASSRARRAPPRPHSVSACR